MKKSKTLKNKIKNKIIFYCNSIDEQNKGLLESMDIDVRLVELPETDNKYFDYYKKLMKEFKRSLQAAAKITCSKQSTSLPILKAMFIKFGNEENILDLYENGTIFMNSREFFRRIEDKELRGDSYEGVNEIKNYGPGSFIIPSLNHTVNYQNIHLPIASREVWGNIYCLFCLSPQTTPEMLEFKMDSRVKNFGSHCLVIKDPEKFMSLMEDKFKFLNNNYHMDFVRYYDKNSINGILSVFDKPKEFSYQKEFRMYLERDGIDPIVFHLGSLKDFSEILTTEQIMSLELAPLPKGP